MDRVEKDQGILARRKLNDKYEEFANLLLTFLEDTYYPETENNCWLITSYNWEDYAIAFEGNFGEISNG